MKIKRIDVGTVNDDFIHDRLTLKATCDNKDVLLLKLYKDGKIASFCECSVDGTIEKDISRSTDRKLYGSKLIKIYFRNTQVKGKYAFRKFVDSYIKS